MAVVAVITVVLGLRKLTDIIGSIGPVLAVFTIAVGAYAMFHGAGNLATANELVPGMGFLKVGPNWLIAGILYPCFAMLTLTPVLPAMGATAENKKTTTAAAAFGTILFHLTLAINVLGILSNLDLLHGVQVPNLVLAKLLGPVTSGTIVIMIFLSIYTTAAPMMWGFCAKIFKDEKTNKFRIGVLALTVVGMIVAYFFPLATLINFMYRISGYVGAVVFVGMISSNIIRKRNAAKAEACSGLLRHPL